MEYHDKQSSLLLNLALLACTGAAVVGGWFAWSADQSLLLALIMGATALILLLVVVAFHSLKLSVTADGITASFGGIITRRVPWAQIDRVEAAPYKWLQFGGWGLRWDGRGGCAYSQPGVKDQLIVHLKSGKRFHVTVKNAPAAMDAVREFKL